MKEDYMYTACRTHGEGEKFFSRKPEWKTPLERPRHRWEDNLKYIRNSVWIGLN
jgi:hypothetical protein